MVLIHLLQTGLWRRLDWEKVRFFFGWTSPLFPSHADSLCSNLRWWRLLVEPGYAKAVVDWLIWRVDLYDGERS
jgi:hypothetical protein